MTEQWQHTYLDRDKKRELRLKLSYSFAKLRTFLTLSCALAILRSWRCSSATKLKAFLHTAMLITTATTTAAATTTTTLGSFLVFFFSGHIKQNWFL